MGDGGGCGRFRDSGVEAQQQQQQIAFERSQRAGFEGSIPDSRPESPMKDKPTARRPPAGLGIDDPTPRANAAGAGAANQ